MPVSYAREDRASQPSDGLSEATVIRCPRVAVAVLGFLLLGWAGAAAAEESFFARMDALKDREGSSYRLRSKPEDTPQEQHPYAQRHRALVVAVEPALPIAQTGGPRIDLQARALQETALQVTWRVEGADTCASEGHPVWIDEGASRERLAGEWIHFPSDQESLTLDLVLECENARGQSRAVLRIQEQVAP